MPRFLWVWFSAGSLLVAILYSYLSFGGMFSVRRYYFYGRVNQRCIHCLAVVPRLSVFQSDHYGRFHSTSISIWIIDCTNFMSPCVGELEHQYAVLRLTVGSPDNYAIVKCQGIHVIIMLLAHSCVVFRSYYHLKFFCMPS